MKLQSNVYVIYFTGQNFMTLYDHVSINNLIVNA